MALLTNPANLSILVSSFRLMCSFDSTLLVGADADWIFREFTETYHYDRQKHLAISVGDFRD